MDKFHERLCELSGSHTVKTKELMKQHTTFRIGGAAQYFVTPENEKALKDIIDLCSQEGKSHFILGNGSNLLVGDHGYDGVIIEMGNPWRYCKIEGNVLTAGAGTLLSAVAREALNGSLKSFEFASGIPGSLGGAVYMNAGAYGSEMADVLLSAKILTKEGEVRTVPMEELELGYRTSCIPAREWVVLEASVRLEPGDKAAILAQMENLAMKRKSKQPLEYPSAGSTFKRPVGHFAGQLIDEAGLRGFQMGGAQVSEKHCGFVINKENASASDVMALIQEVKRRIFETSGVNIEMEVKTLGNF